MSLSYFTYQRGLTKPTLSKCSISTSNNSWLDQCHNWLTQFFIDNKVVVIASRFESFYGVKCYMFLFLA